MTNGMSKKEGYLNILKETGDWIPFLMENSNLPGPRSNLELVQAVAETATIPVMEGLLATDDQTVKENSPEMFVVMCGIVALGKHLHLNTSKYLAVLKQYANDPRWRIREGVAMALQEVGKRDMDLLLSLIQSWMGGSFYELRAVAAGCCEQILLHQNRAAVSVLDILDRITTKVLAGPGSDHDGFSALIKGLSYCWSVAVVHSPDIGKTMMEKMVEVGRKECEANDEGESEEEPFDQDGSGLGGKVPSGFREFS